MKCVLMVTDRPCRASRMAEILSDGCSVSKKTLNPACPVHKWHGMFFGEPVIFKMTSVSKQVTTLDFHEKFHNCYDVDPELLLSCPVVQRETHPNARFLDMLASEASGVDFLVLWFNCDKQGETMCFDIIDAVKDHMISSDEKNRYWRAKFSAISYKHIKAAMDRLDIPKRCEALSILARIEIDLRIGCAFTRFQRKYFLEKFNDIDSSQLSYGLCQIPTLGFCVQRHDEIQNFKPEPYFVIQVTIQSKDGQDIMLNWEKGRFFNHSHCNSLFQALKIQHTATVVSITKKIEKKLRPLPLNYLELIRAASSELGMGPQYTMRLADQLYGQGYISYPRTESSHHSDKSDAYDMLKTIMMSSEWGELICKEYHSISSPRDGKIVGDQQPIFPVKLASRNNLTLNSWKLYNLIVQHFVATFLEDCSYYSHTSTFQIGTETFNYSWKTLLNAGFSVVIPCKEFLTNKSTIHFERGDKFNIKDIGLLDQMTSPPDYLTESELITMMEKHRMGFDSSIGNSIDCIIKRNYITITSDRRLVPTNFGITLVHGYQKIDSQLVEPIMRSTIEDQLSLIAEGKAEYDQVLEQIINAIRQKYLYFVKNIDAMDSVFKCSLIKFTENKKLFSRCGKCLNNMTLILEKSLFLHCLHCDDVYNLPKNGKLTFIKEQKCPLDNFEMITCSMRNIGKSYQLCPYCYNHPGFKDMEDYSGCNQCLHPTCPSGLFKNSVASCLECDDGILVLNPLSGPKWRIECNKCDVIFRLIKDVQNITIEKNKECDCGAQLLKIEYKKEYVCLPQKPSEMTGCLFCCEEFENLVKKLGANVSKPVLNTQQNRKKAKSRRRRLHVHKSSKPNSCVEKMAQLAILS